MYVITTNNADDLLNKAAQTGEPIRVTRIPVGIPTPQGFLPALQMQYWVNEPGTYGQQVWTYVETVPADNFGRVHLEPTFLGRIAAAGLSHLVSLINTSGSL